MVDIGQVAACMVLGVRGVVFSFGDRCIKWECMCSGKCEDAVWLVLHLGEVYTQWNM